MIKNSTGEILSAICVLCFTRINEILLKISRMAMVLSG